MAEFLLGSPLRPLARRFPRLRRALWRLDAGLIRLLLALFRCLPVDLASRIGALFGALVGPLMRRKSAIMAENLAIALPGHSPSQRRALVRACWRQGGRILAEYAHLQRFTPASGRLELDTRLCDPSALQPCVVVSAHLSNWELNGCAMSALGMPNATLYSPPSNPDIDRMLLDSRAALNNQLVPRDNSARLLVRALASGRSVGMVVDRRIDGGEPVPFFGRAKDSPLLPARLALKQNCALVPARVQRLGGARFRVTFYPPIVAASTAPDERARASDMLRQLHAHFEDWIREQPADWLCTKRLWPRGTTAADGTLPSAPATR
jgi:KDO2-lipid IV(A) lauroyltransferase